VAGREVDERKRRERAGDRRTGDRGKEIAHVCESWAKGRRNGCSGRYSQWRGSGAWAAAGAGGEKRCKKCRSRGNGRKKSGRLYGGYVESGTGRKDRARGAGERSRVGGGGGGGRWRRTADAGTRERKNRGTVKGAGEKSRARRRRRDNKGKGARGGGGGGRGRGRVGRER